MRPAGTPAGRMLIGDRIGALEGAAVVQRHREPNYEIVISGRLAQAMERWFPDVEVQAAEEETRLLGWFEDQGALQGFLAQIGDLGLELSGVRRIDGA